MKCLILAGGSGDSLWPLSRKNYPKQFMHIKEGRSLLQETIVRNMPYCDEFIIVTNENYENIVSGQMKVFQSLDYRLILEGQAKGTAAAILMGQLMCNLSELILVVTSDQLIEGDGYRDAVIHAKEVAKEGNVVALGIQPDKEIDLYDSIVHSGEDVELFRKKGCAIENDSKHLWNSGMYIFRNGDLINLFRKYDADTYTAIRQARRSMKTAGRIVRFGKHLLDNVAGNSIESIIFADYSRLKTVETCVKWQDIGNVDDLEGFESVTHSDFVIENNCDDVTVVNSAERQLVVTNDLKDLVVVNTEDAVYVSSKEKAGEIKGIIKNHADAYSNYFDFNRLSYREWGIHELLAYNNGYKVKKVTVFPGMSMNLHQHEMRSEHWSVVEGTATITLGKETKDYHRYESVFVPIGMKHKVANKTDKNVVIIEVGIGETLSESDMVKIYNDESSMNNTVHEVESPIVKLSPAFKDYLWGGDKLRTVFGKKCDYDIIAESWELSAHPDGPSKIAAGRYKGMIFSDYLTLVGKDALGWKCQALDRFPVLIKFIDAKKALSVQIHPDDDYALERENEYGKNEMWYVVDCEPGAFLYAGLKEETSKEEIKRRIADNTITEILNRVDVKKGDVVMIKAGTIHAIGAGIIICEIQQNSNCTYRMYDYDRMDKFGNLRELHVEKALDVVNPVAYVKDESCEVLIEENEHYSQERLVQCKYFEVFRYEVEDSVKIPVDESSFESVVIIEGEGDIYTDDCSEKMKFKAGDSFFINAGKRNIIIDGKATCVVTHV